MASVILPRLGQSPDLLIAAGQSLVVGSFGVGSTVISTAAVPPTPAQLPKFQAYSTVSAGSTSITFATATYVRINASNGSDVEYDYGASPSLRFQPNSVATGIVARAGGGQALATLLTNSINRVTTVATVGDSVLLPNAVLGDDVWVYNASATSMNVFPQSGQSIGVTAANTAIACASHVGIHFLCSTAGVWDAVVGAATS
jgi:hypothetical protein